MNRATFRALTAAMGLSADADKAEFLGVSVRAVQRWGAFPKHSKNEPLDVASDLPSDLEKKLVALVDSFSHEAQLAIREASALPQGSRIRFRLSTQASHYSDSVKEAMVHYVLLHLMSEGYSAEVSF